MPRRVLLANTACECPSVRAFWQCCLLVGCLLGVVGLFWVGHVSRLRFQALKMVFRRFCLIFGVNVTISRAYIAFVMAFSRSFSVLAFAISWIASMWVFTDRMYSFWVLLWFFSVLIMFVFGVWWLLIVHWVFVHHFVCSFFAYFLVKVCDSWWQFVSWFSVCGGENCCGVGRLDC